QGRDWFDLGEGSSEGNPTIVGQLAHRVKRARIRPANSGPPSVGVVSFEALLGMLYPWPLDQGGRPRHSPRSAGSQEEGMAGAVHLDGRLRRAGHDLQHDSTLTS